MSSTSEIFVAFKLSGSTFFTPNNPRLPESIMEGEELLDAVCDTKEDFLERSNAFPSSGCLGTSSTDTFSFDSGGMTKEADFKSLDSSSFLGTVLRSEDMSAREALTECKVVSFKTGFESGPPTKKDGFPISSPICFIIFNGSWRIRIFGVFCSINSGFLLSANSLPGVCGDVSEAGDSGVDALEPGRFREAKVKLGWTDFMEAPVTPSAEDLKAAEKSTGLEVERPSNVLKSGVEVVKEDRLKAMFLFRGADVFDISEMFKKSAKVLLAPVVVVEEGCS